MTALQMIALVAWWEVSKVAYRCAREYYYGR